jgi:hypothetical protein
MQKTEERIADALVSRAEEASKLRVRVIALEKLIDMIMQVASDAQGKPDAFQHFKDIVALALLASPSTSGADHG